MGYSGRLPHRLRSVIRLAGCERPVGDDSQDIVLAERSDRLTHRFHLGCAHARDQQCSVHQRASRLASEAASSDGLSRITQRNRLDRISISRRISLQVQQSKRIDHRLARRHHEQVACADSPHGLRKLGLTQQVVADSRAAIDLKNAMQARPRKSKSHSSVGLSASCASARARFAAVKDLPSPATGW